MEEAGQHTLTRVETVMATIRHRIAGRSLTAGARLPSVRAMAAISGVSTSTVVDAYERLVGKASLSPGPGPGSLLPHRPRHSRCRLPVPNSIAPSTRSGYRDNHWRQERATRNQAAAGCPRPGFPIKRSARVCARCRAATTRLFPTMAPLLAWSRCDSSLQGAWRTAEWKHRPTRSC